jgi:hypothetical protein
MTPISNEAVEFAANGPSNYKLVAQRRQMLLIFPHDLTPSENSALDPVFDQP